jgi:SAM-dependent methyltransferase
MPVYPGAHEVSRFAILIQPAMNRVYADASVQLTHGEIEVFNKNALDGTLSGITEETIGGVPYVTFSAARFADREVNFLSNLSSVYALFEICDGTLRPIALRPLDRFDDDLITIQRYSGKTNEHFTKLLLNVTMLSTDKPERMIAGRCRIFDPLCGRGTTLNQALMYGLDSAGMDIDTRDFDAYAHFIQTWLKDKRVKHHAEVGPVRQNRQVIARRLHIDVGVTKEGYKAGEKASITVVNADTIRAPEFFKPASFDVIATDLPYGVQHGSRTAESGLSRCPLELLAAALPGWIEVLRPGGAMGVAWNTRVASREKVATLLIDHDLDVLDSALYLQFRHWVDRTIIRDVLVARKP